MRYPSWAVGAVLVDIMREVPPQDGAASLLWARRASPWLGAVIGRCWWHRGFALEVAAPGWRADPTTLLDYGEAVIEELMDAGYLLLEVVDLYAACAEAIRDRNAVITTATERADFTGSATAAGTEDQDATPPPPTLPDGPGASTTSPPSAA